MSRPKKKLSVEEKLADLDKQISEYENKIKESMEEKNKLIRSAEINKMGTLCQAISESGKSIDEVISWLQQSKEQNSQQDTKQS